MIVIVSLVFFVLHCPQFCDYNPWLLVVRITAGYSRSQQCCQHLAAQMAEVSH